MWIPCDLSQTAGYLIIYNAQRYLDRSPLKLGKKRKKKKKTKPWVEEEVVIVSMVIPVSFSSLDGNVLTFEACLKVIEDCVLSFAQEISIWRCLDLAPDRRYGCLQNPADFWILSCFWALSCGVQGLGNCPRRVGCAL